MLVGAIGGTLSLPLGGCTMFQQETEDREFDLSLVRGALIWGTPRQAEYYLQQVEQEGGLTGDGQVQAELLRAEIDLRTGNPERALAAARQAGAHEKFRAAALEVTGKAELRIGDFESAAASFEEAEMMYASPLDASRAADLRRLATGLAAYASGQMAEARAAWAGIEDESLRGQVARSMDRDGAAVARGGRR